jgi:hypothetical protein
MLASLLVTILTTGSGALIMSEPSDQDISREQSALELEPDLLPVSETSGSEIVDASAIFLLRVDKADFGPWRRPSEGGEVRTAKLRFILVDVLKGQLAQTPGQAFDLAVLQHGGSQLQYPGLWSIVKLDPGTELVAYTNGPLTDAGLLLTDQHCVRLAEARKVLDDTRAAMLVEKRTMAPGELLTATANHTERFGDTFARFLWSRIKDSVLASQPMLDSYLRLVENPTTRPDARDVYLSGLYEDVGMMSRPARETEIKLAQSMCRLLLLDEAAALRPTIAGIYLPNLVRADAKKPKYSAAEILEPVGIDRNRVSKIAISVVKEEERARKLVAWLAN